MGRITLQGRVELRALGKILIYSVGVVVGGGILAPPLFALGQWAIRVDLLPQLRPFGFEKYLNRAVLVLALAGLWPLLRWLGLQRWTDLQLAPNPRRWLDLLCGVGLASIGLGAAAGLLMLGGDLQFVGLPGWQAVMGALLTGTVVAVIEESFFRGALFGVLRQEMSWPGALVALSLFFAVLHFLRPDPSVATVRDIDWASGLRLLPHVFWQFGRADLVVGSWLTLFLMGCTLGFAVVRTSSLYLAMGLHGGWVFALKLLGSMTSRHGTSMWIGDDMRSGLAPTLLVVLTWVVLVAILRQRRVRDAGHGSLTSS